MSNKSYQNIINSININDYKNNEVINNKHQLLKSYEDSLYHLECIFQENPEDSIESMFILSLLFNMARYDMSDDDHESLKSSFCYYIDIENCDFLLIENIYDYNKDDDEDLEDYEYDKKRYDCIINLLEKPEIIDYYYDNKCKLFNFVINRMKWFVYNFSQKYKINIPDSIIYNMFIICFSHEEDEGTISYNLNHLSFYLPLTQMQNDSKYKELKKLDKMKYFYEFIEKNEEDNIKIVNIFLPIESKTKSANKLY